MKSHRLRRAAYHLQIALGPLRRRNLPTQKLVFTLTDGRSGSGRLAHLFGGVTGVAAAHEPEPRFDALLRDIQARPELARAFLRHVKLPAIARLGKPIYVETSHVFGKGYFEAMLALGVPFSLIALRRDLRKIALSLLRIGSVPGRTALGERFLLRPGDAQFIRLDDPSRFSDYQLCFWHANEMAARQARYIEQARAAGVTVVDVDNDALGEPGVFERLAEELGIPLDAQSLAWLGSARNQRINEKRGPDEPPFREPVDVEVQERAVAREFQRA